MVAFPLLFEAGGIVLGLHGYKDSFGFFYALPDRAVSYSTQ